MPTRRESLLALGGAVLAQSGPERHDTVQLNVRRQLIENFGASDCWSMQKIGAWPEEKREEVARLLFSTSGGIGLSAWRFNLGAGVTASIRNPWRTVETFEVGEGKYDWTRQANERWFLRSALRHKVPQLIAFVNSPPCRMTVNGLPYGEGVKASTNLKPGYEAQFARYLADVLAHFRDNPDRRERLEFDFISPINEPQWDWDRSNQEGCRYGNRDVRRALLALGEELARRKLRTKILAIESGSIPDMYSLNEKSSATYGTPFGDYIEMLYGDSQIRPLLAGRLAYHSYFSDRLDGEILEHRQKLRAKADANPELRLWQTEYCILEGPEGKGGRGRDLTMQTALDVARVIHYDLTLANASAWQWWTSVSPVDFKDGLIYTDYRKPGDPVSIHASKLLWTLGNYSRFIRPGMQRVELRGERHDMRGILGSAYVDARSRQLAMVYLNLATEAQRVRFTFEGGQPRRLTPFVTSDRAGEDLKAGAPFAPGEEFAIPARSAVTLTGSF